MLLGLVRPTSGSALVLGARPGSREGLGRIGALIETPSFYPFLSGRDNLRVLARYAGVPETRITPALEEVELTARAGDRFRTYSLGMKQRLGIAAALMAALVLGSYSAVFLVVSAWLLRRRDVV
jgi:ABC-2 type transport system ATP-binding protein